MRNTFELTKRETEVMDLLVLGYRNKEIGECLGIVEKTVDIHRARALSKIGGRSSIDIAIKYRDEKLRSDLGASRFEDYSLADFAGQCRMQARGSLDPDYIKFMQAIADRLTAIAQASAMLESWALAGARKPRCQACNGTGSTDYAGLGMDPCHCGDSGRLAEAARKLLDEFGGMPLDWMQPAAKGLEDALEAWDKGKAAERATAPVSADRESQP